MKKIIITPDGRKFEFCNHQLFDFQCRFFAVLAGIPKRVTITCDEMVDYNEVYKVEYI